VPLLERVKFCAIFSQMLDEFFQVRVAGLEGQASSGLPVRSPDGRTPQQALAEIRSRRASS
jgi:polyphosphate kinase